MITALLLLDRIPQWGTADAVIKVPFDENTELKHSPFKAWSRSVYSHTCFAYCQGFLPCLFLPFQSIHKHLFQILSDFFPVLAVADAGSCVGPQNKIGHPAGCRFPCWVPTEYKLAKKTQLVVWWLVKWITWRLKFVFSPDVILCDWLGSKHQLTNYNLSTPTSQDFMFSNQLHTAQCTI